MNQTALDASASLLQRAHVLDACRDGGVGRSTIAERAGCSRTTAYRATSELVERGLLEQNEGGYRLTGFGAMLLDQVERFQARLDGARQLRPLLEYVDAPPLVEHAHLFRDATVIEADPETPYRIDQRLESIIGDTSREMLGATSTFSSPAVMETAYEVIRSGVEVHWVLTQSTFEMVREFHGEGHDELRDLEFTSTHAVESIPVDVAIYDDTLVVPGFDDETGVLGAIATTENASAVEWARERIESLQASGERLD